MLPDDQAQLKPLIQRVAGDQDLVLFLDGVGVGEVVKRGSEEFRGSWSRPKWHIVFEGEKK